MKSDLLGMRRYRSILLGVFFFLAAAPANAVTLDFYFSFTNQSPSGSGLVEGIVRGLTDNATGPATSIEITSNTDGFGIGEYIGNPTSNSWTVSAGSIYEVYFSSQGTDNVFPDVTCCSLDLLLVPIQYFNASLTNSPDSPTLYNHQIPFDLAFTPISPVPLPGALPLFATGLGALGLLGWRRKRKQVAA